MTQQIFANNFDPNTKIWSSLEPLGGLLNLDHFGKIVFDALSADPDFVGQISHEDGYEMRNSEIRRNSVRVALNLRDKELIEGDVIAVAAGNSRHLAAVVFGAIYNGIAVNGIDTSIRGEELLHILGVTRPKLVFCDAVNYADMKRALEVLKSPAPIFVIASNEDDPRKKWKSVNEVLEEHPEETDYK